MSVDLVFILDLLYNSSTVFVGVSAVLLYLLKDTQGFNFAIVTLLFFVFGAVLDWPLKELDKETYVYRYIFWALSDIAWMATIAYFGIKDKVYLWQSSIGQLIVVAAPLLQLLRLVDRHIFSLSINEGSYSYIAYLYKTILPLINFAVVILCFVPLYHLLRARKKLIVSKI